MPPGCSRVLEAVAVHFWGEFVQKVQPRRGAGVADFGGTIRIAAVKRLSADLRSAQRPAWCRFDIADS